MRYIPLTLWKEQEGIFLYTFERSLKEEKQNGFRTGNDAFRLKTLGKIRRARKDRRACGTDREERTNTGKIRMPVVTAF